eukprot:1154557-Pelagomonas_calceolata.AAC.3
MVPPPTDSERYEMLADLERRSAERVPEAAQVGKEGSENAGNAIKDGLHGVKCGLQWMGWAILLTPVAAVLPEITVLLSSACLLQLVLTLHDACMHMYKQGFKAQGLVPAGARGDPFEAGAAVVAMLQHEGAEQR